MKTLITVIFTTSILLVFCSTELSAIHPVALEHMDYVADNMDLSQFQPPDNNDKKEALLHKILSTSIVIFIILFIIGLLSSFNCYVIRFNNPTGRCRRLSSGFMLYCVALLTLARNKYTKHYERREARRERRRLERLRRENEDYYEEDYEEEGKNKIIL